MRQRSKLSVPANVMIYFIIVLTIGLFPSRMHFHYVPVGQTFLEACGGWSWKIVIGLFGILLPPSIFVFYSQDSNGFVPWRKRLIFTIVLSLVCAPAQEFEKILLSAVLLYGCLAVLTYCGLLRRRKAIMP